jgi:mannose-6-phosphate isomerase
VTFALPITNIPRDYAWGMPDGITRTLGWAPTGGPEAELWLGAHPLSPARILGAAPWRDLAEWERDAGAPLPYLMKVLSAASNLSLQAHPTTAQARAGFAREEAAGIALEARERNYKDPHAKPEIIVAVEDGFDALCGFRPVAETLDALEALNVDDPAMAQWRTLLAGSGAGSEGVRAAFLWLLSGAPEVARLVAAVTATGDPLVSRLAEGYPGDAGILAALMLNHLTLRSGEALWLPAGNIHAYLRGTGVELMGPSDNVLRGGLTPKHVDRDELEHVLDFTPAPPPRLAPVPVSRNVVSYRPGAVTTGAVTTGADVGFELLAVTGDAAFRTGSAAILLAVDGTFAVEVGGERSEVARGGILFLPGAGEVSVTGSGRLFVATGR